MTDLEMLEEYYLSLGPNARAALVRQAQLLADGAAYGDFDDERSSLVETRREFEDAANYATTEPLTYSAQALGHLALAGACLARHLEGLQEKRRIAIVEAPGGLCDGSGVYDGKPCPRCRACS